VHLDIIKILFILQMMH